MGAGKGREKYMCFRATGTKAAPGKGRELRPKWKNLSWVLRNLSFKDFSAALGQRAVCKSKGRKVTVTFPILLPPIFPKFWAGTRSLELSLALMASQRYARTPDERGQEEWLEI